MLENKRDRACAVICMGFCHSHKQANVMGEVRLLGSSQKMKVNPLKGLILLGLQRNYLPENFKIKSYEYVR
jgi:hypothetical protein